MARIVFCEDEEQIRKLIGAAMSSTTHTIEITKNGREGLVAIERIVPDLIVTDLTMPEMDGFALAAAVRSHPALRHIPIMFVTASVQRDEVERFEERGASAHLTKPFSPRALREMIDELVGAAPEPAPLA
jgi:CheY-like chemotaxis protein